MGNIVNIKEHIEDIIGGKDGLYRRIFKFCSFIEINKKS